MKRNIGNIFVSQQSFEAVNEMFVKTRAKNISHTIDEIVVSYMAMAGQHVRLVEEINKLKQEAKEHQKTIDGYRKQLIK
jgi:hypothetical protein